MKRSVVQLVALLFCFFFFMTILEAEEATVHFFITTEENQPIVNATFQLYKEGELFMTGIESDEKGEVILQDLVVGAYQIKQTSGCKGYEIAKEGISFYYDGSQQTLETIQNKKMLANVVIQLVDEQGKPTAKEQLLVSKEDTAAVSYLSDEQGNCMIQHLEIGSYQLEYDGHTTTLEITETNHDKTYAIVLHKEKAAPKKSRQMNYSLWFLFLLLVAVVIWVGYDIKKRFLAVKAEESYQEPDETCEH